MVIGLVFSCFVFLLMYAYIFYPFLLKRRAIHKIFPFEFYTETNDLPSVSIVIPIHNEEKVIEAKIKSILQSKYPKEKIIIYLGLDNCTDNTLSILQQHFYFSTNYSF